jgi:ABC-2 type transport system ATP-binding protein
MVQILTTLIAADAGTVRVGGHDVASDPDGVRRVICVTGQFAAVDNLLTGAENLRLMADLHRLGRLDLAMTLVGDPRIMFLDEPTTGLDPRSRRTMWQIVRDVVAGGVTVFLTTQYLDEADELADQIALLDDGRLIAQGTADELKRRVPGERVILDDVFLTLTK